MADVKRRSYDSSRRQERARANHRAMLEAALALLLEEGYAGTSLALVADRAGVSPQTAYKAFRNKPKLVKDAFDYAVAGDDEPVPISRRERAARIFAEPDPARKLAIYVDGLIGTQERSARLQLVARAAAAIAPEMAEVWAQMTSERLTGMGRLAANLVEGGHLRPDVSLEEAQDVLWTCTSPELWELFVLHRGWTPARYGEWIHHALVSSLLPEPS